MTNSAPRRLRLNAFSMNCVSHITQGLWRDPTTRQRDYTDLGTWVSLARILEAGKFDALFLADVIGFYDSYGGSRDAALRHATQAPVNDPSLLIPAMAYATEHLGFAYTHSILQAPPYDFARRASTLDHLTGGRVAWNIVTSYLETAGRNLGFGGLPEHDERYARAEEYVEVTYKLWEGSWDDDAVLNDTERGIYVDPAKVHEINHVGRYYDVVGPHICEPSPQRTPVLFQAGSSEIGRSFAARHAEGVFISARNPRGAKALVEDIRRRAAGNGRAADEILFFQGLTVIVGGTEEEAMRKQREIDERIDDEGTFTLVSGWLGVDLGKFDPERPIGELLSGGNANQGIVRGLIEAAPDKTWTFGELVRSIVDTRITGAPEQVADGLADWHDAGVDGINLTYVTTPTSYVEFIDAVVPVLRDRGLVQRDYAPGTLREKLSDGRAGPRLPSHHPGAAHRRDLRAPQAALAG